LPDVPVTHQVPCLRNVRNGLIREEWKATKWAGKPVFKRARLWAFRKAIIRDWRMARSLLLHVQHVLNVLNNRAIIPIATRTIFLTAIPITTGGVN